MTAIQCRKAEFMLGVSLGLIISVLMLWSPL